MIDEVLVFGPFRLDPRTLELWRGEVRVPLEPLPARILARLAAAEGAMVARRELLELGWPKLPGAAEQSLNTCIHQIRQALAHEGPHGVELETLRGRGYRLVASAPATDGRNAGAPRVRRATAALASWGAALGTGRLGWVVATVVTLVVVAGAAVAIRRAHSNALPVEAEQALERARYLAEETRDLAAALALLDTALQRFPRAAALHAEHAEISLWLGDLASAREGSDIALSLRRTPAGARRVRATLAMLRSDWAAADAEFALALRIDPRDPRTLTALAYRRVIEGEFTAADELMRQALRIDPLSTALHRDAGLIYLLAGRYAEAERYCLEAIRFHPDSRWATDCLFDVMVLTGRTTDGARWGRALLELYGSPTPSDSAPVDEVVAATEAWRLDAWKRAVGRGADPFGLALAYAANGRTHEAIGALRAASTNPGLEILAIAVDPRLASLREYRDFQLLLDRLKLRGPGPRSRQSIGAA